MQVTLWRAAALVVALTAAIPASAQFGHPLKGTWSGDWGTGNANRSRLLLELHWDGKAITGTINPGPNAVPLQKASLDAATWTVHLEADGKDPKDPAAKPVHYVVDGKLENIGSANRILTGTWTQGGVKGDFKLVRN